MLIVKVAVTDGIILIHSKGSSKFIIILENLP